MRAEVRYNGRLAGILSYSAQRYEFSYDRDYLAARDSRPISVTLPLREAPYSDDTLFPVFTNMLSEGVNKAMQNRLLKIDERDYFSLLLATAGQDNIGPLTIQPLYDDPRN